MSYGVEAYTHRNKETINTYSPFNLIRELSNANGSHSYKFSLRSGEGLSYVTLTSVASGNDKYISSISVSGGDINYTISTAGSMFMRTEVRIYAVIKR